MDQKLTPTTETAQALARLRSEMMENSQEHLFFFYLLDHINPATLSSRGGIEPQDPFTEWGRIISVGWSAQKDFSMSADEAGGE